MGLAVYVSYTSSYNLRSSNVYVILANTTEKLQNRFIGWENGVRGQRICKSHGTHSRVSLAARCKLKSC